MATPLPTHRLGSATDLEPLLAAIGEARVVLLGEASHGTHEYYTWRTALSKRLIREKGFSFIAVEGDWPDCFEVNAAIKQDAATYGSAAQLLQTFNRWPTWMWGNWEVAALTEWLHGHNLKQPAERRVGFYGLDVYSLWESLQEVLHYAEQQGDGAMAAARQAFGCFEPYSSDPQEYARAVAFVSEDCHDEVNGLLRTLRRQAATRTYATLSEREQAFAAEQNALVAVNAERYYKAMLRGGGASWNVRDEHMMETLTRLFNLHGPDSKAIVWAHNTHIGDARYTDMRREDMVNIGQLAREQLGRENVFSVGFGSYQGSVIAGKEWGALWESMTVPTATRNSWEALLHNQLGGENALLFSNEIRTDARLAKSLGHRAIGVVYRPQFEQFGNYVPSLLPDRYDAFVFIDRTHALHPLVIKGNEHTLPDLYPWGE
ncbi:erythromycin esterase family protein [Hymenobacter properus]|uniref:Erythromycin esterase family protein n=1 Tax=Hymenobacter properus TaxID=2791026 RepID=A0A931BG81_9BACT|nr:erythromycin esterase family protein [Hymenobacter properus]MBF9142924.1 erythromycin esterase family protein [Hymenobacter properus]MBR7721731.1 erythromycin esterase family protein [Microvirga sp. SRT04]